MKIYSVQRLAGGQPIQINRDKEAATMLALYLHSLNHRIYYSVDEHELHYGQSSKTHHGEEIFSTKNGWPR